MIPFWACAVPAGERPLAVKGVIDFAGWDFNKDGITGLDGAWEFCRMRLLSPDDFRQPGGPADCGFMHVPGRWNPGWKLYFPEYYRGFATFRLRIITGGVKADTLGVRIHRIRSAYRLYVNGIVRHREGQFAAVAESIVPGNSEAVVPLPGTDGGYEIIIHAANADSPTAGITGRIEIGGLRLLSESRDKDNLLSIFMAITLLLLGVYLLFIFALQRSESQYMYFGLFCLCILAYIVGLHDFYWRAILTFVPWDRINTIMAASICMGCLFILLYLQRIFPLDAPRRLVRAAGAVNGMLAAAMLAVPLEYYGYLFLVYHGVVAATAVIGGGIAVRAAILRRSNALIIQLGLMAVALSTVIDILIVAGMVPGIIMRVGRVESGPWSTLLMCVILTVVMSRDFIRTQRRLGRLTADYEKMSELLEKRKRADAHAMTGSIEGKINAAIEFIRENYTEDISRENLAATLDMHPDSFSRYFKMHTGKKYGEYLNDLRIAEAVRLLGETDTPIITIAMNVGFNSLRTFNHAFINATGRTPSDYRKDR